jgi:NAD(P)-dependent dehydrogenase (short-subunit alcohol dehydrogenase family)
LPRHAQARAVRSGEGGVNALTEHLAAEYAERGIRVNGVVLGVVASEGFTKGMEFLGRDPQH